MDVETREKKWILVRFVTLVSGIITCICIASTMHHHKSTIMAALIAVMATLTGAMVIFEERLSPHRGLRKALSIINSSIWLFLAIMNYLQAFVP